jgi:hypothetical protein
MPGLRTTIRIALAAAASATVALGVATVAAAAPVGPCADVPYVGVCVPVSEQPSQPSQQSLGEVVVAPDASTGSGINVFN